MWTEEMIVDLELRMCLSDIKQEKEIVCFFMKRPIIYKLKYELQFSPGISSGMKQK
jgi:hypothetical protein